MAGVSPKVLQALIEKLMESKSLDRSAKKQGLTGGGPEFPTDDYHVGRARRDLQEAQPSDPLASPREYDYGVVDSPTHLGAGYGPREGLTPRPRIQQLDPGRLPGSKAEQGVGGQHWDVIIEETGAYGTPVFATKTVRAASREDAIKKVEAEGPFSFQETDPFDGSTITSIANPEGISGNPVGMVHAQPAAPPSRSPIEAGDILPEERSFGRPSETRRNPVRTPDDDIPF